MKKTRLSDSSVKAEVSIKYGNCELVLVVNCIDSNTKMVTMNSSEKVGQKAIQQGPSRFVFLARFLSLPVKYRSINSS